MWKAAQGAGFMGGRVLEPGCGPGVFMATAPAGVDGEFTGVERDPVTAEICALLHPGAEVRAEPFEKFHDGGFTLAIGNVPFANVVPYDPYANKAKLSLHNYFLAKGLQLLDPGGLLLAITSSYTLDADGFASRLELIRWGRLLGAVRLPNGAFREQSGTDVMTDVVMFQRRRQPLEGELSAMDFWGDNWMRVISTNPGGPRVNEWFAARPEMVLGTLVEGRGMYSDGEVMVDGTGGDIAAELGAALEAAVEAADIEDLPRRVQAPKGRPRRRAGGDEPEDLVEVPEPPGGWPAWAKEGSLLSVPGRGETFARIANGRAVAYQPRPLKDRRELRLVLAVRDAMAELIAAEAADCPGERLDHLRGWLNVAYDTYQRSFGPLNRGTGVRQSADGDEDAPPPRRRLPQMGGFARVDPDYPSVLALEVYDPETAQAAKSEIFRQRVVRRRPQAAALETLSDAVVASVAAQGRIDVEWMAAATGWDWSPEELASQHIAFRDPAAGGAWQPAPLYLSGNVRAKLAQARSAAVADAAYAANVAALDAVVPGDVTPEDISVRLGATWLSTADIEQFVTDTLGGGVRDLAVTYTAAGSWNVEGRSTTFLATTDWGTSRVDALRVVESALKGKPIVVTNRVGDRTVVDPVATEAANEKLEAWNTELHRWCFAADPVRCQRLLRAYNDTFRSWVAPQVGPEWINPPGLREGLELRTHQREAAARIVLAGDLLLAHEVGAGKTLTMAAAGMEMRRLGLVSKPAHIVPNHLVEQYAGEIRRAFPEARVLIPFESERTTLAGRKALIARCATDDWDAVVIPLSTFALMPVSPQVEAGYIAEQLAEWREALTKLKEGGGRRTVKRIEKRIEAERARLEEVMDRKVDDGTLWEHTGIDFLFVDEAHLYKSLPVASANGDFAVAKGALRARLLEMKVRWLRDTYPDRRAVVALATGTPVANRVAELWIMQRYVQPEHLRRCGVATFDAWAAAFGKVVSGQELKPTGKGWRTNSRFAAYQNVPELMQLVSVNADFRRAEDMGLQRPALAGGQPEIVSVEATDELSDYVADLVHRSEHLSGKDPAEDNMLLITGDGRKAALHLGMVGLTQEEPSKMQACAERVESVWRANAQRVFEDHFTGEPHPRPGALQVVFCDLGVPGSTSASGVCVYDELADALTERGIPRHQIAAIHDYSGPNERDRLFASCRDGSVSVLMGSSEKMGTGVNIQSRLAALHHLDAAWRPADIEQREGRILRPGNQFDEVQIFRYVTEGSFDTYTWQGLERKARFIGQLFAGRCDQRTVEEIDEATMDYAKVKAAATGDPRIIEHAEAVERIGALSRLKAAHDAEQTRLSRNVRYWGENLPGMRERLDKLRSYPHQPRPGEAFTTADGTTIAKPGDADRAIRRALGARRDSQHTTPIGQVAGIPVRVAGWYYDDPTFELGNEPAVLTVRLTNEALQEGARISARLHHEIKRVPARVARLGDQIAQAEEVLEVSSERLGRPFAKLDELTEAQARAASLEEAIREAAEAEQSEGRDAGPDPTGDSDPGLDPEEAEQNAHLQRGADMGAQPARTRAQATEARPAGAGEAVKAQEPAAAQAAVAAQEPAAAQTAVEAREPGDEVLRDDPPERSELDEMAAELARWKERKARALAMAAGAEQAADASDALRGRHRRRGRGDTAGIGL